MLTQAISPEAKLSVQIPWTIFEVGAFDWMSKQSLFEIMNVDLPRWLGAFERLENIPPEDTSPLSKKD